MVYTEDFRNRALKLAEEVGVKKACKELQLHEQTLYRWKKSQREMLKPEAAIERVPVQPFNINYQQELEEERKVNKFCQQTIEYLVEENRILRQQCDNYLTAIRLITQK